MRATGEKSDVAAKISKEKRLYKKKIAGMALEVVGVKSTAAALSAF